MEFMNVGGGELLIIILLALVLFSPEDILKLMRSVGKYARTARQMWSNVSKSLQEDYIPDEVKDVVKETQSTMKEAQTTLTNVRQQFNDITTSVGDEVSDATQLADHEISEAVNTVNETTGTDNEEDANLESENDGSDQTEDTLVGLDDQNVEESILPPESVIKSDASETDTPLIDEQQIPSPDIDNDNKSISPITDEQDTDTAIDEQPINELVNDSTTLTKEDTKKTQDLKTSVSAKAVNAKLAKVTEDSLKEDGNDS